MLRSFETLGVGLGRFSEIESETESANRMAFWWPLLVLGFAFALCRFLLMLIPPNVPSIDVDASDGTDLYVAPCIYMLFLFINLFRFLVFTFVWLPRKRRERKENEI